jgi:hypothetical protein
MMKNSPVLTVSRIILISALSTTTCTAVNADQPVAKTNQIRFEYVPPENPEHQQIYEFMKERQVLERLQEFLSPFRLKWPLDITLIGCDGEADAMYDDDEIEICYEYIADLQTYMPAETTPSGVEPVDALIGPFVDTVLHEFAHGLFDYADVPILGREEDAADQVSAYLYLQLGKDEAHQLITGTVYAYMAEVQNTDPPDMEEFADEHGTSEQRLINLSCMAYGADPKLFKDLVTKVGVPQYRVDICEEEFELISLAFQKLIGPHIDAELAQKVYGRDLLLDTKLDLSNSKP